MPKDEWGVKRLCPNCSTRFYDLQNDPMTCPSCGAVHTVESLAAGKTRSTMVADKPDPKAAVTTDSDDDEGVVLDDEDDDEDVDLGDDVLDDDADDDNVSLDDLTDVATDDEEES